MPAKTSANSAQSNDSHGVKEPQIVFVHVMTVSDTRTSENDESGKAIVDLLKKTKGVDVIGASVVKDELVELRQRLSEVMLSPRLNAVIITGGTGLSLRDKTIEAMEQFIEKPLPGFGEIFRTLSYQEIGPHAMLSAACAGLTKKGILLFALPGSKKAAVLGVEKLILPVLPHAVGLAAPGRRPKN